MKGRSEVGRIRHSGPPSDSFDGFFEEGKKGKREKNRAGLPCGKPGNAGFVLVLFSPIQSCRETENKHFGADQMTGFSRA